MVASSGGGSGATNQHRDVVHQFAAGFVSFGGREGALVEPARPLAASTGWGPAEAIFAEQGFVWTGGFGHTIGE